MKRKTVNVAGHLLKLAMTTWNDGSFRRYFDNVSWLLAERVWRLAINLFVFTYVARYLGPERFGQLSYAQSFVALFTAIAMLGLDGIVVRDLVRNPLNSGNILGSAFALKILGGLSAFTILTFFSLFTQITRIERDLILIIGAGLILQSATVVDFHFQSQVQSRYVVQAQLIQSVASSILKLVLVWMKANLIWFALAILFDGTIFAFALFINYIQIANNLRTWRFCWETSAELLRNSWPMILSGVSISIYMRIDQVMIREFLDADAVGQYSAAVKLSEVWYFIPVALNSTLFPAIIRAKQRGEKFYYYRIQKLFDLMVYIALAIVIPISLLSTNLIELLYGSNFSQASQVLNIHIWAAFFVFLNNAAWKWYLNEGLQILALRRLFAALLINILLNYWTIPRWGICGAAYSTLLSRIVGSYMGNLFSRKTIIVFNMMTRSLTFGLLFNPSRKAND